MAKALLILARENPAHNNSFWLISYPSGEAQKITNDLNNVYSSMSLAADANILATVQNSVTSNIWIAPVGDAARATQVTSGSNRNGDPQWTPDGKLVYNEVWATVRTFISLTRVAEAQND